MRNTLILPMLFLLTACGPSSTDSPPAKTLHPYHTSTAVGMGTVTIVIAETPLPTPTPFTYIIQQGDTISELAETFNISQDDLRAANPDISPNSLTIGETILIPSASSTAAGASSPTPVPVPITQTACHPTADNGLWCFALVQNDTNDLLENVSVQLTLVDHNSTVIASQTAWLPLDILPPNTSLPAYAFFPNTPANVNSQVQLLSALQLSNSNTRYLPAIMNNTLAQMDWNGRSARLSGQVYLPAGSQIATQVWVAAVAYDKDGRVVGVKRWEGGPIQPGTSIPFNFTVAGLGSGIDAVEFVVEARP